MSRSVSQMLADQYYNSMVAARRRGPLWSVVDLGELAVRLGSIVHYDRRGDVLFMDGFGDGLLKWIANTSGAGGAVALNNAAARSGGWSCKLTAGSDVACFAAIVHLVPYPVVGRMGLECSFAIDENLDNVCLLFWHFDGAREWLADIRYSYLTQQLEYLSGSGSWVVLATDLNLCYGDPIFWTWKVVADFESGEWVRVMLNEREYDLEGELLYSVAVVRVPHLQPQVFNYGVAGQNGVVYVDDVIITQNEPRT